MKFFPLTLKDRAKIWLSSLRPHNIRNWNESKSYFLKKFFPSHKTSALNKTISNFKDLEYEKFFAYWERYMEVVRTDLYHDFDN